MSELLDAVAAFVAKTHILEQIRQVDAKGLFTNPWFLVPFLAFVGYKLYKQAVNALVVTAVLLGLWLFSGSPMMQDLIVGGELQIGKVLPVAGVFLLAIAILVYFLFMRSD